MLGGGLLILLAPLSFLGHLRLNHRSYLLLITLATLLLYLGLYLLRRIDAEPSRGVVLVVALLLRLAMLPMGPSLSDDVYRYMWDGRLVAAGVNPYYHVPADSSLARFHDELYAVQGYPTTHTIYPPAVQLLFAGCSIAGDVLGGGYRTGILVWKVLLILAEMAAIVLMLRVAARAGIPARNILLYAWHPLVVVELVGQGHTDALWVLAMAMGMAGYVSMRRGRGMPGVAFGGAVRLYPLALLPLWMRYAGRREAVRGLLLGLPFLLLLLPLADPTALATYGTVLQRFTNYYEFNGGFYYGVKALLDVYHIKPSNVVAGAIGTGVQLLLMLAVWLWPVRSGTVRGHMVRDLAWRALLVVTVLLVFGAKVHVWYFAAPLALLPFVARRSLSAAWLWAAAAAPFTYLMYAVAPERERLDVVAIEWGVFALLAVWGLVRYRRREGAPAAEPGRRP